MSKIRKQRGYDDENNITLVYAGLDFRRKEGNT
jgi:hypothetical protein